MRIKMTAGRSTFSIDYNNLICDRTKADGLREDEIQIPNLKSVYNGFKRFKEFSKESYLDLPYMQDNLDKIKALSGKVIKSFDNVAVLGIGGSALGTKAVFSALKPILYNQMSKEDRGGFPRLYVLDNIDPSSFSDFLNYLDVKKTFFNVISKSGETAEINAQFLIISDILKKVLGKNYKKNFLITTDALKGSLRRIANEENYETLTVPENVGGRYSVFSSVGLFPLACTGIDIDGLLNGAGFAVKLCSKASLENPALLLSNLLYKMNCKGKNILVLFPYSDALSEISAWFCQLWAESLGKRVDNDGKVVYKGQTPVRAIGVTDQHSQLQLYSEGPPDKVVMFFKINKLKSVKFPVKIPPYYKLDFFAEKGLEDLFLNELKATEASLVKCGRSNLTVAIDEITPFSIGELMQTLMITTHFQGIQLNINPFDQPGVEEGKRFTLGMLGKKGFEDKKKECELLGKKDKKYILKR